MLKLIYFSFTMLAMLNDTENRNHLSVSQYSFYVVSDRDFLEWETNLA